MTNEQEHIDELIAKQAAEGLSSEEQVLLDQWVLESSENADYAKEMAQVWQLAGVAKTWQPSETEVETAWTQVAKQIHHKPKVIRFSPYWAAAASIVLLISLWWFWPSQPDLQFVQTGDSQQTIVLSDGSEVILMPNSTFNYLEQFEEDKRSVELTGSAHFSVQGNADWPFKINTGGAIVEVVGTQFLVNQSSDSVFVDVEEGKVKLYRQESETEEKQIELTQGESGFVTAEILPEKITTSNELRRDWLFESKFIGDVLKEFQGVYNVDFVVDSDTFLNCQLSARYTNASLNEILEMLELTFNISVTRTGDVIRIDGEGC